MMLDEQIASHYGKGGFLKRIQAALAAAAPGSGPLNSALLAPVDEFHIGGRPATEHLAERLPFRTGGRVLDVGCGLGGAARFMSAKFECHVEGLDLTPEYVDLARQLSERTGFAERTSFVVGSACDMSYPDACFDGAYTIHVAMNISDRDRLYREVARVLKPGAYFGIYDVMQGPGGEPGYPMPWAEDAATSHLTTPEETRSMLVEAGFEVLDYEDRTAFGLGFFQQMKARVAESGPPPLGLHLLMGESFPAKLANMIQALEAGQVEPAEMIVRLPA